MKLVQVIRQDSDYVYELYLRECREEMFTQLESETRMGKLPVWKLRLWWARVLKQFIQNYCVRMWVELIPFALKFQKIFV